MPTIMRRDGFRYFFYSNEGNEPPHIHVVGRGGEMKVWLDDLAIDSSYRLSPGDQKSIMSTIRDNQKLLREKWDEFASRKS